MESRDHGHPCRCPACRYIEKLDLNVETVFNMRLKFICNLEKNSDTAMMPEDVQLDESAVTVSHKSLPAKEMDKEPGKAKRRLARQQRKRICQIRQCRSDVAERGSWPCSPRRGQMQDHDRQDCCLQLLTSSSPFSFHSY